MNETTNDIVQTDAWSKEEYQDTLRVFAKRDQMAAKKAIEMVPQKNKEIIKRWIIFVTASIASLIGIIYICAEIFWSILIYFADSGARMGVLTFIIFVAIFIFYGLVESLYFRIIQNSTD